ncbi:unnamed protein product [Closterium sp. NIES-64]|nr:unnamed protein product [Closterium sp. NIES-64]
MALSRLLLELTTGLSSLQSGQGAGWGAAGAQGIYTRNALALSKERDAELTARKGFTRGKLSLSWSAMGSLRRARDLHAESSRSLEGAGWGADGAQGIHTRKALALSKERDGELRARKSHAESYRSLEGAGWGADGEQGSHMRKALALLKERDAELTARKGVTCGKLSLSKERDGELTASKEVTCGMLSLSCFVRFLKQERVEEEERRQHLEWAGRYHAAGCPSLVQNERVGELVVSKGVTEWSPYSWSMSGRGARGEKPRASLEQGATPNDDQQQRTKKGEKLWICTADAVVDN